MGRGSPERGASQKQTHSGRLGAVSDKARAVPLMPRYTGRLAPVAGSRQARVERGRGGNASTLRPQSGLIHRRSGWPPRMPVSTKDLILPLTASTGGTAGLHPPTTPPSPCRCATPAQCLAQAPACSGGGSCHTRSSVGYPPQSLLSPVNPFADRQCTRLLVAAIT